MEDNMKAKSVILSRIKSLIVKTISIKILLWYAPATVLFGMKILPWYAWLAISGMIFAIRTTEKILLKLADKWPGPGGIGSFPHLP